MGFLGALQQEKQRSFLVHGQPGAGKTHLIGTALEGNDDRMVLVDFKAGAQTIRHLAGRKTQRGKHRVVTLKGLQRYEDLWGELVKLEKSFLDGTFKWLALDNFTDMSQILMADIRGTYMFTDDGKGRITVPSGRPEIQDYGMFSYRMKSLITKLETYSNPPYNMNVIITAWSKRLKGSGTFEIPRSEMESVSDMAAGACNYVFYLKAEGNDDAEDDTPTKHTLYTKQNEEFQCRDRSGVLPAVIENPKFGAIIEKLKGVGL